MIKPMLATLGTVGDIDDENDEWAFEMKWDGIRAIATVDSGRVALRTRNGLDVTVGYPELTQLAGNVDGDAVLDGEIVALNKAGRPDFGLLQRRMKLTRPAEVATAAKAVPVHYMVFDILSRDGSDLTGEPYSTRRLELEDAVRSTGAIQVPAAFAGDLDAAMAASKQLALEGVVAKRRDSTYAVGARSRAWIKLKHHKTQEVIIGGWRPGSGRRAGEVGSLLMGVPDDTGLRYVGRVGTGFGDADITELTRILSKLERRTSPFVDAPRDVARDARWVSPTLVGEVEFAEWTSALKLRQPSWRGWRTDKNPSDVTREG
jgi:bifunctional non-homologous end joining protein LigD